MNAICNSQKQTQQLIHSALVQPGGTTRQQACNLDPQRKGIRNKSHYVKLWLTLTFQCDARDSFLTEGNYQIYGKLPTRELEVQEQNDYRHD